MKTSHSSAFLFCLMCRKMYKNLSSTFMKAIKKKESEVTEKLAEGNENDHTRHEDYILSYIGEPLRTEVYSYR